MAQWLLENGCEAFPNIIVDFTYEYEYEYRDYKRVPIVWSFCFPFNNKCHIQLYVFQYITPEMLVQFTANQDIWLINIF